MKGIYNSAAKSVKKPISGFSIMCRLLPVVSGQQGTLFKPHIPVGTLAWFERFKKSQGNFAFGLRPITDQVIVDELKRISGIV